MDKLVSVLIITMNRQGELFEVLKTIKDQTYSNVEILIAENGSKKTIIKEHKKRLKEYDDIQYFVLQNNLGVSGGRNYLLKKATGDVIIEIDDDALLVEKDSISNVVNYFNDNPEVGIQAFKSINYYTKKMDRYEFPFRNKKLDIQKPTECAWFIGVGHAFTRDLINKIGYYRDFFPWGSEEQDFALRTLSKNYEIIFNPAIKVLHKKSPFGRINNPIRHATVAFNNMMKIPAYNLPFIFLFTYLLIRGSQFVFKYRSIKPVYYGFKDLINDWSEIKNVRNNLGFNKSIKLMFNGARVLY